MRRQCKARKVVDSYMVNQLELDAMLGGDLNPDDAGLDLADRARNVGQGHAKGCMVSKEMSFRSHDDVADMALEVLHQRGKLGVVLWQSRREEGQEGPSWIHVDLTRGYKGGRGHIGTV